MDYGKDALMRVTELTDRLGSYRPKAVRTTCNAVPANGAVAEYSGYAAILILTLTSTGSGEITVKFGGEDVCTVTAGGTSVAAFTVDSGGTVALSVPNGVTVSAVTVSAYGRVARL